ncbi:MAG TPA: PKD domain-containing protein [Chitinophagales bacterium]|nr:PKD domain-containing protein [Chitinophagales bacterium]
MAFHIIGGEIYYTCLGNNDYQVTLKIYRDCSNAQAAQYDDPAFVTIYNATGLLVQTFNVFFPGATSVQPDLSNPCLMVPPNICVEQGVYQFTANLPPTPGGYDISYQRCCRNSTIFNIIDPANTGATYTTHIPDVTVATCNSSPRFTNYPPIVICSGTPLVFDHSATDPDGDVLRYSLCTPNQGATAGSPQPNPAPPPPYDPIFWASPYTVNNQIGGNPPMKIDSITGLLTADPVNLGQYVVGICVKEYRNGLFISQNVRDFQFNVTTCNPTIVADFSSLTSVATFNDTLLVCGTATVVFNNLSFGSNDYAWDFGVPGITTDVSVLDNPTYTYPDTGVYKVMLVAAPGLLCGDTTYKYIEIRNGVNADFNFQNECIGNPFQFVDLSAALDGILASWQWTFGDGGSSLLQNPSHTYTSSGNFNVTLTTYNSYGCSQTISKQVTVFAIPVVNAAPDTFICNVDSVTLHADNGVSYLWQPNYNISDTSSPNPVVDPKTTTVYEVTVTNANGCQSIDSVTIQVTDTVIASAWPDTTICEGQFVQLQAQGAVYYVWNPQAGLNNALIGNPVASPSSTTMYIVDSYIGSCLDEDTLLIIVLPRPIPDAGPDVTINQGETTQLNATGGENYLWQPPDALSDPNIFNPVANPLNTITYTVTVTGANGCKAIDSITITVTHDHEILVPTAFTPNGDGLNDVFQFFTRGIARITSVKIFSRWGEMIYYSPNGEEGWDGTYKGLDCEIETYAYLIDGITYDGDAIQKTGPLTLIR